MIALLGKKKGEIGKVIELDLEKSIVPNDYYGDPEILDIALIHLNKT